MRIIFAEDEAVTRKFTERQLRAAGHDVRAFPDGQEALDAYMEDPSDAVVTDWLMPRLTGIELCKAVRVARVRPYTQVVVITSLSGEERTIEAFAAGVDDVFTKPAEIRVVLARLAAGRRGQLADMEHAMSRALELCQAVVGPERAELLEIMGTLTGSLREQQSYARCRAFLRRQIRVAVAAYGESDARTRHLASELEELQGLEERG